MEQSRVENILRAINDGEDPSEIVPQSRVENLLIELGDTIDSKMDGNVGSENAGKILGIDQNGDVAPASAWGTGIVVAESVVSGEDYALTISEEE